MSLHEHAEHITLQPAQPLSIILLNLKVDHAVAVLQRAYSFSIPRVFKPNLGHTDLCLLRCVSHTRPLYMSFKTRSPLDLLRKKMAPRAPAQSDPSKMLVYTGEHNVWPLCCIALPVRVSFLDLRRKACAAMAPELASTPQAHAARGSRSELCQLLWTRSFLASWAAEKLAES